jgi:hypothetical protein
VAGIPSLDIAEKLHAYTLPRARPNSRLKDLSDLALLASVQSLDAKRVRAALLAATRMSPARQDVRPSKRRSSVDSPRWDS